MGKTKTAFVGGIEEGTKKPSYDKAAKEAKRAAAVKAMSAKQTTKIHLSGLKGGQRVKVVEAEPIVTVTQEEAKTEGKKAKEARIRGKKYLEQKGKVDRSKLYSLPEAITKVKETSYSAFDGTVELTILVKKTGLTSNIILPFSTGRIRKIEVADEATIDNLKKGKTPYDLLLATPEMMPKLIPFARILGPKGLMPNPKNGTVIKSIKEADKFKGNNLTLKTEKAQPIIHTTVGKVSQKKEELEANIKTMIEGIGRAQIVKAFLKPTMGPSVKIQL